MMCETGEIKLSQYAVDANKLQIALSVPNLTRMDRFDILFMSTFPMFEMYENDDKVYITDFTETAPKLDALTQTASRAIMFTGTYGNGKRTAEKYYGEKLYNYIAEQADEMSEEELVREALLHYRINSAELMIGSNDMACERIESLFHQIIIAAKENSGKIIYVAFGDVTDILKNKKSAKCFVKCMEMLINTPDLMCVLTCVYDGTANELKERLKNPFIIEEISLPDEKRRDEFFTAFCNNHINIQLEADSNTMAKLTENFTFRMLARLAERIVIQVKGELINDRHYSQEKYAEFVSGILPDGETKISVSLEDAKEIAESIRNSVYVKKQKNLVPMAMEISQAAVVQQQSETKTKVQNTQAQTDKQADDLKPPDTIAALKKDSEQYRPPFPSLLS